MWWCSHHWWLEFPGQPAHCQICYSQLDGEEKSMLIKKMLEIIRNHLADEKFVLHKPDKHTSY